MINDLNNVINEMGNPFALVPMVGKSSGTFNAGSGVTFTGDAGSTNVNIQRTTHNAFVGMNIYIQNSTDETILPNGATKITSIVDANNFKVTGLQKAGSGTCDYNRIFFDHSGNGNHFILSQSGAAGGREFLTGERVGNTNNSLRYTCVNLDWTAFNFNKFTLGLFWKGDFTDTNTRIALDFQQGANHRVLLQATSNASQIQARWRAAGTDRNVTISSYDPDDYNIAWMSVDTFAATNLVSFFAYEDTAGGWRSNTSSRTNINWGSGALTSAIISKTSFEWDKGLAYFFAIPNVIFSQANGERIMKRLNK
jgi:hypothetical protein